MIMVDSTSDAIIMDPKAVIKNLFDTSCNGGPPTVTSDFDIPKTFENAFSDQNQLEKIPRLDKLPTTGLQSGKLVRFLGMVQDTSFSQEIYVGMTKSQDKWLCHRYGDSGHVDIDIQSPNTILDERNAVYMTSIPGCSKWLEASESLETLSLEDSSPLKGDGERIVNQGQKQIGVVVKCYSSLENSLKVCDLVEVIGILQMPDEPAEEDTTDVVIHAITARKKQLNSIVLEKLGPLSSSELSQAKELFLRHATSLFEGDILAAQSLLLNLTSVLTHRNPTPLGFLPMNIYSTSPEIITKVTTFIRSILPAVAVESLSIDSLNSQRIYPQSDGEKLSAGRGQLVSRTTLVVDESKMREGKLLDMGIRNLRFLSRVAVAQKLSFEFPYHEFEIDTDISVFVLGDSKSILPMSVAFPHIKAELKKIPTALSQTELDTLRKYVAQISELTITIQENIADEMQNEFVRTRKAGGEGIDEIWFGKRIVVAKGLSRINARGVVSRQDWEESIMLCTQWESRRK